MGKELGPSSTGATVGAASPSIPWAQPDFWGSEERYVLEALRSTWISGGEFVERLEVQIAAMIGVEFALTASSGTTAIHLAYLGLNLEPGDEVIVPGFGFQAAANIALHMHAKPIFADVDPNTWCITAEEIERLLSPRTRAVVPVHTYGNVCSMDEILAVATAAGVIVVEDAAESFASRYKDRYAGGIAPLGCLSFQATKTITTGEGGMVLTNSEDLYRRMALYRSHGMLKRRYWHEVPGHNFRLTNVQAAIGCAQLEQIDRIIAERRRVHRSYQTRLADVPGIRLQQYPDNVDAILWAMAVEIEDDAYPQGRDRLAEQMTEVGIETRPGFYAASILPLYDCPALPISERLSAHVISLPTFPTLSDDQIDSICGHLAALRR
jgi:perosamine synthetase